MGKICYILDHCRLKVRAQQGPHIYGRRPGKRCSPLFPFASLNELDSEEVGAQLECMQSKEFWTLEWSRSIHVF